MKTKLGLSILAAVAMFAVAGCNQTEPTSQAAPETSADRIVRAASVAVTKGASNDIGTEQLASIMEQIGCPKLANLFRDLYDPTLAKADATASLPESFNSVFACFGISSLTNPDDYNAVEESFENFESLIDCICGSKALSNLIAGRYTFTGYGSVSSSAGGTGFGSTNSSAGGTGFGSTNSSAGGTGFGSASSSAGGTGFGSN